MATEIRTYDKRPECAVPDCKNDAFVYVAGRWICGLCTKNWADAQREKEQKMNDEMFKDVVEASK